MQETHKNTARQCTKMRHVGTRKAYIFSRPPSTKNSWQEWIFLSLVGRHSPVPKYNITPDKNHPKQNVLRLYNTWSKSPAQTFLLPQCSCSYIQEKKDSDSSNFFKEYYECVKNCESKICDIGIGTLLKCPEKVHLNKATYTENKKSTTIPIPSRYAQ